MVGPSFYSLFLIETRVPEGSILVIYLFLLHNLDIPASSPVTEIQIYTYEIAFWFPSYNTKKVVLVSNLRVFDFCSGTEPTDPK